MGLLYLLISQTHPDDDEDPTKVEASDDSHNRHTASIQDNVEDKVDKLISGLEHQTKQTNRTLDKDKKCQVKDKQLIQPCQQIFLDGWNG